MGVSTLTDQQIVDLYWERDEQAIVETRQKYGGRMHRVALNILRNGEDAEECVADTMLKAWEAMPPGKPTMLGAFLAKIVRNISINKWKAKNTAKRGGGTVDILLGELSDCLPARTGPEEEFEAAQVTRAINDFLEQLDKQVRVIFVVRYFHGESILGIAERFNISESKVKSMLFRTRNKLSAHLEKEGVII